MTTFQKTAMTVVLMLLLSAFNTSTYAKSHNQLSNSQIKQAYKRHLVKKKPLSRHRNTSQNLRNRIIKTAKQQLHKRYRWGGTNPQRGFDCSGLVQYVYKTANIKLPRTASQQYGSTKRVSLSHLKTGDLIFFNTRRRTRHSRVNHVGIYVGGGNFIHAPRRGKRVSVTKLDKYWRKRVVGAGGV